MPSIINATTTAGVAVQGDNSGSLQLQTNNGTTAVTIDTSQNVGIGTTSINAANKLEVTGDINTTWASGANRFIGMRFGDGSLYEMGLRIKESPELQVFAKHASGAPITFLTGTTATERMRIDSSGNLLVGTTNTSESAGNGLKLLVGSTPAFKVVTPATTSSSASFMVYSSGASAYRFYVTDAGTINATSTTITGISDQRVKENIVDLPEGLDVVMALKPRKFDWKEGKGKNIKGDRGFIAQEFETVFPDMIEEWKDPAPEGEEPYKAVNANLIPILVKAIQELNAKVVELEAKLNAK